MGRTVADLQRQMSSREFSEWIAFSRVEPFGPAREDLRSGIHIAMTYNANRRKGQRALQPHDIFGNLKPEPRVLTRKEVLAKRLALETMLTTRGAAKEA